MFLSLIRPQFYQLVASLVVPDKPGEKMHAEVVMNNYEPQLSEILWRFRFHIRFRKDEESVASYVSVMRPLAQKSNFKVSTINEMLCSLWHQQR